MRIAVYNENKNYLLQLKQIIYRYAEKYKLDVLVECFNCGKDLLASKNRYHIVFLDYCGENCEGLKIANMMMKIDNFCTIVFSGCESCFSNDIFTVSVRGFLTYPIKENEVCGVLSNYFSKKINGHPLLIKSGQDTVCLKTNEIVYIEANNKHCVVHLGEKSICCNKTMANVYEELPKMLFLKINRANVINSEYINRFNSNVVMLKTGKKLYISRNYRKDFKRNYSDFINRMSI